MTDCSSLWELEERTGHFSAFPFQEVSRYRFLVDCESVEGLEVEFDEEPFDDFLESYLRWR